ncbi:organic anion transporter 3-like isoform X1 [Biomphalaria glabrata]|uniref:Organic anion transporter 3-like isoform X1 n=1 Tax=Biomphalaria glabrata TaxID=6526 RepID=A0A9U8ELI5_BIOGL|nr:organic anion transporter 3-like isoform X1 [Biomphalaria glabrata]XP_013092226.2 organic anion transporter 3-like isoform X1 [Biomphalaria glabrata]
MDQGAQIDEILESLKWNGRYQIIYSIVPFLSYISIAISSMSVVFIGKMVEHHCKKPHSLNITVGPGTYYVISNASDSNFNVTYGACSVDVMQGTDVIYSTRCPDGYEYGEPRDSSFVSEWDLVCDKESLSDVSMSVNYISEMIWALVFTRLSDIYGRKKLFMLTNSLYFVNSMILCVLPNFVAFLVFKFLQTGASMFASVIMVEMMPTKHRALPIQIIAYLWPASLLLLCLLAYLTRELSWRYLQLSLGLVSAYVLVQWWVTDESLRWLCVKNKKTEAEQLVKKMARLNKVSPEKALHILRTDIFSRDIRLELSQDSRMLERNETNNTTEDVMMLSDDTAITNRGKSTPSQSDNNVKFLSIVRNKHLMKILVISCSLWFTDCLAYDGLLMVSPSFAQNFYVGFALSVMVEYPASVTFNLIVDRVGRRQCIVVSHLIAGFCLVVSTLLFVPAVQSYVPESSWVSLGFVLLGRYALSVGYTCVTLFTPELLPTSIRSTGSGFTSVAAYVAVMIAPHARTLKRHIPWAPSIIFGSICIILSPLTFLLPETKGHELSQTLEDMEKWLNDVKSKNKPKQ